MEEKARLKFNTEVIERIVQKCTAEVARTHAQLFIKLIWALKLNRSIYIRKEQLQYQSEASECIITLHVSNPKYQAAHKFSIDIDEILMSNSAE